MKTIINPQPIYLMLLVGLLSACAQPILKLHPIAEESIWADGRQVVKQQKDGLKIVTAFDGEFAEYLTFDTEIFNQTDQPMLVSPSDFVGVMLDKNQDTLQHEDFPAFPYVYLAADPDQKIKETEIALKKAEARHKRAQVFNAVLLVLNVVGDVSSATSRKPKTESQWRNERNFYGGNYQAIAVSQAVSNANYVNSMNRLSHERGNWQTETFRKTTLHPGDSMRGYIYVPKNKKAAFLRLSYRDEKGNLLDFLFEQEKIKVAQR